MVSGFKKAYMSVFFGNMKYEIIEVEANEKFQTKLTAAEVLFWYYVKNKKTPPDTISWETFKAVGENLNGKHLTVDLQIPFSSNLLEMPKNLLICIRILLMFFMV